MANTNGSAALEIVQERPATAVVVSRDDTLRSYSRGLEPNNIEEAYKVAGAIAKTGLCGLKTAEEALTRIMTGRELGLTCMQSINGVYTVDGRPGLYAEVMEGLCTQHPDCLKWHWVKRTDAEVELLVERRGRPPMTVTWTLEDAKRALLLLGRGEGKSNWDKYPRRMLVARARSEAAGLMFPDAIRGMKAVEELTERDTPSPRVSAATEEQVTAANQAAEKLEADLLALIEGVKDAPSKKAAGERIAVAKRAGELTGPHLKAIEVAWEKRFTKKEPAAATQATTTASAATPPATTTAPAPPPPFPDTDRGNNPNSY